MAKGKDSVYNIRIFDDMARQKSAIHGLDPVVKLIVTIVYLIVVVSFDKYEVINLLPFLLFPTIIFSISDLPLRSIAKKVLLALPFIIGIGILNPVFDQRIVLLGNFKISLGWLTFFSLFIKSMLTVTASILLIATTGMDKIAFAMRKLKVPKIFVLQLLLTYRYISVLIDEGHRMTIAYALRAPKQKGIAFSVWGSFAGQLLLRTFDRAQRLYQSMNIRGFDGEYKTGDSNKSRFDGVYKTRETDQSGFLNNQSTNTKNGEFEASGNKYSSLIFLIFWISFFIISRFINIPLLIGGFISYFL